MQKIKRDAFLYMEPQHAKHRTKHAQCSTCMMWTGDKSNTCTIHGSKKVTGSMTCGLYVEGDPMPEMAGKEHAAVTPKISGLLDTEVRCENCICGGPKATTCEYFEMLNEAKPEEHDLDETIIPHGCCNAFRIMEPSIEGLRRKAAKM